MPKPEQEKRAVKAVKSVTDDFIKIINFWRDELEKYDISQLKLKPDEAGWSMGQLYFHLVDETKFYFSEVERCLANNENQFGDMTSRAKEQFRNNCFPDERFKGPVEVEVQPQPESKEQLKDVMENLIKIVIEVGDKISNSSNNGKTKHPGHDYLNAKEWFQYAEMHLRHHLKQKERIDTFLKNRNILNVAKKYRTGYLDSFL